MSTADVQAARNLELAIQDDAVFVHEAGGSQSDLRFRQVRAIGVTRIRVNLIWAYTMPRAQHNARHRPPVIAYDFTQVDRLIDRAAAYGIRVHLSLTGPAPRWANARRRETSRAWYKPDPQAFGEFAAVVARHFEGRVGRYSIWNEPNWKTWLGPLKAAPRLYRSLYLRGYQAIKEADPRAHVLFGETSPFRRSGLSTAPLAFLRAVTCVDKRYKPLRRCTPLRADGYAHHPYDFRHAPAFKYPGADNVTIGTLGRLTRALDKLRKAGALRTPAGHRMPIYLTEFGYFASGHRALPARKRARYLQQAHGIALRNPRVKSQLQYLLVSPPQHSSSAFFDLGLLSSDGKPSAAYRALRRWFRAHRSKVKRPGLPLSLPGAR